MRIGFIVNPIAGMGGSVGLKGTDGDSYFLALKRGAKPVAPHRALIFLNNIRSNNFEIISAAGNMGEDVVKSSNHRDKLVEIVGETKSLTSRLDTINIAREMSKKVNIIVFVGGDGTARDIYEAIGTSVPVIGVPSGVKMYSSVFAINPVAAARLLDRFIAGEVEFVEREVLDVDEESFRRDKLVIKLYGYLLVPYSGALVQSSKTIYSGTNEELSKEGIAEYIIENMESSIPYVLGPGSTVKTICKKLDLNCTLLGVDILLNKKLLIKDAWEKEIIDIINQYGKAKIIVTPIGGQGFLFGRGNQQLSPRVLSLVDREDIIVVATEQKLRSLPYLLVDTGDKDIDEKISGYIKILVDYNRFIVTKVISNLNIL
ncbi:MAG: ATP-NAD kinase family protein [Desulfurococcaceae archaeon]